MIVYSTCSIEYTTHSTPAAHGYAYTAVQCLLVARSVAVQACSMAGRSQMQTGPGMMQAWCRGVTPYNAPQLHEHIHSCSIECHTQHTRGACICLHSYMLTGHTYREVQA